MDQDQEVQCLNEKILVETVPVIVQGVEQDPVISPKDTFKQVIAGCISFLIVIQVGANMSYSSILLPQLAEKGSPMKITLSEASWIASVVAISLPLGALIIGVLVDAFGRKRMCCIVSIPFAIAWLFQIFATKVWHIYVSRIIAGFTGGLTTVSILYVSEISHPSLRQALLALNSVSVSLGVLLTYFFGTYLRWRNTAILMCVFSVASGVAMTLLPESPHWYIIFRNDYQKAQRTLRYFYKSGEVFDSQYHHLVQIKAKRRNTTEDKLSMIDIIVSEIKLFGEKSVYKPTIILIIIFMAQQITGGYVIIFYALDIFRKLDRKGPGGTMSAMSCLILLGIVRFITSIIAAFASKSIGRRPILMISGIGMAFCSFFAGVYIYFNQLSTAQIAAMNITPSDKTYNIAFFFVLGYVAFGSFGFLVIPWTLIGELLPVKVRGVIGGILISFAYVLMFVCVKVFLTILDTFDIYCILYIVAILSFISSMFIYFFLPETLGKNFSEIESYFER